MRLVDGALLIKNDEWLKYIWVCVVRGGKELVPVHGDYFYSIYFEFI